MKPSDNETPTTQDEGIETKAKDIDLKSLPLATRLDLLFRVFNEGDDDLEFKTIVD